MSIPRTNRTSNEYEPWVNSAPAAASFTTSIPVLMDSQAAIEVIYTGLDASDAYVKLTASNSGDITRSRCLTQIPSTLSTANSSILFNINNIAYGYIHVEYDAGSNTDGAITMHLTRKYI